MAVNFKAGSLFLESLRLIKRELPELKTVAGISNVSFGLPSRSLLNRIFLAFAVEAGLDAAIFDPCDSEMLAALSAAQAINGQDKYLKNFLNFIREKKSINKD